MPALSAYLAVGATAAIVTFLLIPLVIRISPRLGAVVEPDERRVHTRPTPTAGGVAMMAGVVAAAVVAFTLPEFDDVMAARTEMLGVVLAAGVIWSVGFVARYHQLFDEDRFPAYFTASVRLGYRWSLGDPFAP